MPIRRPHPLWNRSQMTQRLFTHADATRDASRETACPFVIRGFHIGRRAIVFWADVKNSTIGFNVVFDADVKKQPRVTQCENRYWDAACDACAVQQACSHCGTRAGGIRRHRNTPPRDRTLLCASAFYDPGFSSVRRSQCGSGLRSHWRRVGACVSVSDAAPVVPKNSVWRPLKRRANVHAVSGEGEGTMGTE